MERQNESNLLTKECIVTALLRLMQEKKYESISITDITTLAGVSRMAYYRNYKSKDEILIKYLLDQKDRLVSDIGNRRANDLKEIIKYGAMFFQDNAAVIQAVYEAGLAHTSPASSRNASMTISPSSALRPTAGTPSTSMSGRCSRYSASGLTKVCLNPPTR